MDNLMIEMKLYGPPAELAIFAMVLPQQTCNAGKKKYAGVVGRAHFIIFIDFP
jgi:hypothetical protein